MPAPIRVFIDTSVLLRGFAAHRSGAPAPAWAADPEAKLLTFEKCVFECYMAFRGVGGKKPSEGRGDWAARHLTRPTDPPTVHRMAERLHRGSKTQAFFWANHIGEAGHDIDGYEAETGDTEFAEFLRNTLESDVAFQRLCDSLLVYLTVSAIDVIPYVATFASAAPMFEEPHPAALDYFVRSVVLPSEDLEIVIAALRGHADLFVTDDLHLRTCAMSLGLNHALAASQFCSADEYAVCAHEWRIDRSG